MATYEYSRDEEKFESCDFPMTRGSRWTRDQLLVAFSLYCRLPFGRLHRRNPEIIRTAEAICRTESALAMKLGNIASLDPEITSTGRSGLPNASVADRAMWEEMNNDWEAFATESGRASVAFGLEEEESPDQTPEDDAYIPTGEDRTIITTARVGQRFFRNAVLAAYNERCCITGLSIPTLLVASHIIPWRHDIANRTNPRNGLLLSALHDKAFDNGLITVDDDMTVRVSNRYTRCPDSYFTESIQHYHGRDIIRPEKFAPDRDFLSYHRKSIFQG